MDSKDKAINDLMVEYVLENANLKLRIRQLEIELESIKEVATEIEEKPEK